MILDFFNAVKLPKLYWTYLLNTIDLLNSSDVASIINTSRKAIPKPNSHYQLTLTNWFFWYFFSLHFFKHLNILQPTLTFPPKKNLVENHFSLSHRFHNNDKSSLWHEKYKKNLELSKYIRTMQNKNNP